MEQFDYPFVVIQIPSNDDIDSVQGYANLDDACAAYEAICREKSLSILFVILENKKGDLQHTSLLFGLSDKEKTILRRMADADQFHTLSVLARKAARSKWASRRRTFEELKQKMACLSPTKYTMLIQYISK